MSKIKQKGSKKIIVRILLIICFILACIGYLVYHFTWDTQSVPKGDLLRKVNSPQRENCAYIYQGTEGATVDDSVIVEIKNNKTNKKKIIYVQYHQSDVTTKWINENTIQIGKRKMDIEKDVYDWRH